MPPQRIAGILLLVAAASFCPGQTSISGYVTRSGAPGDFDVNGQRILIHPGTVIQQIAKDKSSSEYSFASIGNVKPYLGEPVDVFGKPIPNSRSLVSDHIVLRASEPHIVTGLGIVDAVLPLPPTAPPTDRLIRADGYPVLISAKTQTSFDAPLSSASDIRVNIWISFHGIQGTDGIVLADKVAFGQNGESRGEDSLRKKNEYDPAAVDPNKRQSILSRDFRGLDPKQIPPYQDKAMQAHIDSIAAKLIPRYQQNLPDADQTKIHFRFQLIDNDGWLDIFTLPSGIVLVPYQVVERMQNDSEIAAVLAHQIAAVIEKQPIDAHNQRVQAVEVDVVSTAVGGIVPGLALAGIATGSAAAKLERLREERGDRVSISLLRDAGYDTSQAPLAWWLLSSNKPQDLAEVPIPKRALYLYQFLGETWPPNQP